MLLPKFMKIISQQYIVHNYYSGIVLRDTKCKVIKNLFFLKNGDTSLKRLESKYALRYLSVGS